MAGCGKVLQWWLRASPYEVREEARSLGNAQRLKTGRPRNVILVVVVVAASRGIVDASQGFVIAL